MPDTQIKAERKGMGLFERIVNSVSRVTNSISCVALVAMMGLVFVNVVSRALGHPIFGTYETVGFLASILIAFSIAECAVKKGHIVVNILEDLIPKPILPVLDTIVALLATSLYLVLAWQCAVYAGIMWERGELSMSMEIPFYPFIFVVAFGFLMLGLVLMIELFKSLAQVFRK